MIHVTAPVRTIAAVLTGANQMCRCDRGIPQSATTLVCDCTNFYEVISPKERVGLGEDLILFHQAESKRHRQKLLHTAEYRKKLIGP